MTRIELDDPGDPRLARFLGLRDHALRQERERPGGDMAGSFMAEGDVVIARAVAAGVEIDCVLVDARRTDPITALCGREVDVVAGGPAVLEVVTGRPRLRDPIACCIRPPLPTVARLLETATTVLVAEGVNNPTNMGVIVRNAAGLGVDALLVDPTSCDPLYRRAVRVSMGEVFAIPHARTDPLPAALDEIHGQGYRSLALTPSGDGELGDIAFGPDDRVALVVGAEGPGLTDHTLRACTDRVSIPMASGVDSINVASAAAVAAYAIREARRAR